MVNSLCKVDFSYPTGHYTWKIFTPPPPLEKILGAPLMPNVSYMIQKKRIANGKKIFNANFE